jgi:hypothetical protein
LRLVVFAWAWLTTWCGLIPGVYFVFFFYYRFQIQWVRAADGRFGLDDTGETQASANAKDRNRELRWQTIISCWEEATLPEKSCISFQTCKSSIRTTFLTHNCFFRTRGAKKPLQKIH